MSIGRKWEGYFCWFHCFHFVQYDTASTKWWDDYFPFGARPLSGYYCWLMEKICTRSYGEYPVNEYKWRDFLHGWYVSCVHEGDNKSIHGRGHSWSAGRGRCKRSSMIHYGARPGWTAWNWKTSIFVDNATRTCWIRLICWVGAVALEILLKWPEFWLGVY